MLEPSDTWLTAELAWLAAMATRRMFSMIRPVSPRTATAWLRKTWKARAMSPISSPRLVSVTAMSVLPVASVFIAWVRRLIGRVMVNTTMPIASAMLARMPTVASPISR